MFLQGENANSLLPVAFGARFLVRPTEEARARAVLAEFEAQPVSFEDVDAAERAGEAEARRTHSGAGELP